MRQAFLDALFHAVFGGLVVDSALREVSLGNVGTFEVVAVFVTLAVAEALGAFVVSIAEVGRDGERSAFAGFLRGLADRDCAAVALGGCGQIDGGMCKNQVGFGQ